MATETPQSHKWEEISVAKIAEVNASLPSEWLIPESILPAASTTNVSDFISTSNLFTAEEIKITSASATDIVQNIKDGKWTAEIVTRAFSKAAAISHQLLNTLTVTLFDDALAAAKALDVEFAQTGKLKGPLHGVPVSLKDNINIAGKPSTVGFVAHADVVAEKNSYIVDLLQSLGAVVYVKTNVPTAMMMAETVNNVFGRTTNPLNRNLTPGGSSGGESALIAFGGSPLGIGTDIGGSLRIPASTTGLFALRPSAGRFPNSDFKAGIPGQEAIQSVQGPLARTLEDVILYSKAIVDSEPWFQDPKVLPIPWRSVSLGSKLKFAVLAHDGYVSATPPVRRALETTVEKLKSAGHEVVEWDRNLILKSYGVLGKLFTADGGQTIRTLIESGGEPWHPNMESFATAKGLSVYELWQAHRERNEIWKATLDQWNSIEGLDGIIMPASPYVSTRHGEFTHIGYTGIWNLLDYTAAVFPSGVLADENIDVKDDESAPVLSLADKTTKENYDPKEVHGLPVGLQLVGRRLEEEKVLALVGRVLDAVKV